MKTKEKTIAIQMRKAGNSLGVIAKELKVSKGTASKWLRNIKISKDQLRKLNRGTNSYMKKCLELRMQYQEEGRIFAKRGNLRHAIGCMLYWAGGKELKKK